jgi:transcriptional regulator with XRE-family HTH domain
VSDTESRQGEGFGPLLRRCREEQGLSRRELVEKSGLSYPYVSQLETGTRSPSPKSIAALARALAVDPAELWTAMTFDIERSETATGASSSPAEQFGLNSKSGTRTYSPASLRQPTSSTRNYFAWRANPDFVGDQSSDQLGRHDVSSAWSDKPTALRVVEDAAALISALPANERLDALALVQHRVLGRLVEDRVRAATKR